MNRRHLIIFTRYPEPGKTKSRLIPALGKQGAARLQREMTAHTLDWAGDILRRDDADVEVLFEGGDRQRMKACFGNSFTYRPQGDGDLGRRMARAFHESFQAGTTRVVIVGSDCPGVTPELVRTAFDRLSNHDLVLGPAIDGGYYLLGLRSDIPQLFDDVPWGTDEVLKRTLYEAARLGLSVAQLEPLADVDRPEDLEVWNRIKGSGTTERISVIIPTFDEAAELGRTLDSLRDAHNVETLVADAGSCDETTEIARAHGASVLCLSPHRARQMNRAAAAASGSILLFLHADTRLPEQFDSHVRQTLAQPGVVAGAFRLQIEGAKRSLRLIQWAANLRARYLHMPYGDQAIFLHRKTFQSLGGFADLPVMEDFELVRRLGRLGKIEIVKAGAVTSARRWKTLGPWRTTWVNQKIIAGYHLGVSPQRLTRWYHP